MHMLIEAGAEAVDGLARQAHAARQFGRAVDASGRHGGGDAVGHVVDRRPGWAGGARHAFEGITAAVLRPSGL
jgi:hypothetical protein